MDKTKEYNNFIIFSNKFRFMNLLLTLSVAAMHLSYWVSGEPDIVIRIMRNSAAGSMGWFFFASAFWYFGNYSYENALPKFRKRLRTLLIPYVVWNLLRFLYLYGIDIIKAGNLDSHWKLFLEAFLFVNREPYSYAPIISALWYIIRLLSYFLVAPLIYFLLKDKYIGAVVILATFFVTRNGSYYSFEGFLCIFMIGAYISINFREKFIEIYTASKLGRNRKILGTIGCVSAYALLVLIWIGISGKVMWRGVAYLFQFLVSAVSIFLFDVVDVKQEVGAYSFMIYCSHVFWAPILNIVIGCVNNKFPITSGMWAMLLLVGVVLISIAICKITKKYFPTIYGILTGGR